MFYGGFIGRACACLSLCVYMCLCLAEGLYLEGGGGRGDPYFVKVGSGGGVLTRTTFKFQKMSRLIAVHSKQLYCSKGVKHNNLIWIKSVK